MLPMSLCFCGVMFAQSWQAPGANQQSCYIRSGWPPEGAVINEAPAIESSLGLCNHLGCRTVDLAAQEVFRGCV